MYMHGFLQHQAALEPTSAAIHPEDAIIWLPSQIPATLHLQVCSPELPEIKERICTAHCYDGLDTMCHILTIKSHILTIKSHMVMFKNKNIHSQWEGTHSWAVINQVHERVRVAAEKYQTA